MPFKKYWLLLVSTRIIYVQEAIFRICFGVTHIITITNHEKWFYSNIRTLIKNYGRCKSNTIGAITTEKQITKYYNLEKKKH